jgi:16S rRNA (guanine527-N7)-methyltransferase
MLPTIYKYFPDLSNLQKGQFVALEPIYRDWNSKINVISRKDIDNLYLHHVLHSLSVARVINFLPGAKIVDVGTGGGFPGVPLAIMFPEVNFLLLDSIGKKIKVVDAVVKELGLKNVKTLQTRAEDIDGQFDFALARAVTKLDTVWGWVKDSIKKESAHKLPNGLLYLKGGDIAAELPKGVKMKTWQLDELFVEDYFKEKALYLLYED